MKKFCLVFFALLLCVQVFSLSGGRKAIAADPGVAESETSWAELLGFMRATKLPAAKQARMFDLVDRLVDAESQDPDGLTVAMHAAALGNLQILSRIDSRRPESLLQTHPRTGLTILHFAAQATGAKGAEILTWFFRQHPEKALEMVNRRALNQQGRGNGHTVAMEAVFTKRTETVKKLLDLSQTEGLNIDFSTPAVTGWAPKTIAEREKLAIAASLPPGQVSAEQRLAWVEEQDNAYLAALGNSTERATEEAGVAFLKLLGQGKTGDALAMVQSGKVNLNGNYGRLQGTALSATTTPGPGRGPADIAAQAEELLKAGADPRVSEASLMFVHGAFRSAVFGFSDSLRLILDHVERTYGKKEALKFVNARGPENGVTMGLDAAWRRRADILNLWLDKGGNPDISSFAGETILDALEDWTREARENPTISPPPADLKDRIKSARPMEAPKPAENLGAACDITCQNIQEMVAYIESRSELSREARGHEVCDKAVQQLNLVLEDLRLLRKQVPESRRGQVEEISRKVTVARFLIIADCASQKGKEVLQAAQEDLERLKAVL